MPEVRYCDDQGINEQALIASCRTLFPDLHDAGTYPVPRADFGVSSVPGDATVSPYPKNQAIFFNNGPDTVSYPSVCSPASGFGERYPPG